MACKAEEPASTYAADGTDAAKNEDAAKNPPRINLPPMYRPGSVGPNRMNPAFGTQPFSNNQDDDIPLAFAMWRDLWGREYATREEYDARLKNFEENYLEQLRLDPPTYPLWMVLGYDADRPVKEHNNYIRLDWGIDSDDEDDPPYVTDYPVVEKDGTVRWVPSPPNPLGDLWTFVLAERRRLCDDKGDTKEEDQDKRPQIGCGGQNKDVAVTVENEES